MNRVDFLEKLKEALENEGGSLLVRENVEYYNQYITEEVRRGRSEREVLEELGDPWIIAKTILGAGGSASQNEYTYESPQQSYGGQEYQGSNVGRRNVRSFAIDSWWKKLLLILCVIGIIFVVFAIITGVISLVVPIMIPVLIVSILIRLVKGKNK